jgi:hypothetical protein
MLVEREMIFLKRNFKKYAIKDTIVRLAIYAAYLCILYLFYKIEPRFLQYTYYFAAAMFLYVVMSSFLFLRKVKPFFES